MRDTNDKREKEKEREEKYKDSGGVEMLGSSPVAPSPYEFNIN